MRIEIDNRSGFCFGVVNAITQAENELKQDKTLYCLGEIVHNSEEVERLKSMGLQTISQKDLKDLKGKKVMLRAHGEPPETYRKALEQGIQLIDASCPVVLKLQIKVREGFENLQRAGGQVVVFGKKGHAEVIGLLGQTSGTAIIVESANDLSGIDFTKPIELFSQTTKSSDEFKLIAATIEAKIKEVSKGKPYHFKVHNTICGQVANRKEELKSFAAKHDVILFVSGKASSNGKMLFEVCKTINPRSHFISSVDELEKEWLKKAESLGICGATSTPLWLMENVAQAVELMSNN